VHESSPTVSWRDGDIPRRARWLTADVHRPPATVHVVGDDLPAGRACRLAADGVGLL
jgi:hypothetical protein